MLHVVHHVDYAAPQPERGTFRFDKYRLVMVALRESGYPLTEHAPAPMPREWLEAVHEGDDDAIDHLMEQEHPGYADAPTLSHEQMRARLTEIANINQIAGTQDWIAHGAPPQPQTPDNHTGRRKRDRRR